MPEQTNNQGLLDRLSKERPGTIVAVLSARKALMICSERMDLFAHFPQLMKS